jgi:hypothetical protein
MVVAAPTVDGDAAGFVPAGADDGLQAAATTTTSQRASLGAGLVIRTTRQLLVMANIPSDSPSGLERR